MNKKHDQPLELKFSWKHSLIISCALIVAILAVTVSAIGTKIAIMCIKDYWPFFSRDSQRGAQMGILILFYVPALFFSIAAVPVCIFLGYFGVSRVYSKAKKHLLADKLKRPERNIG